jgi:hypothetical protein
VLILDAPVAARDRPRTQRARVLTSDAADGPVDDGEAHPGQFTAGQEVTGLGRLRGCGRAARPPRKSRCWRDVSEAVWAGVGSMCHAVRREGGR